MEKLSGKHFVLGVQHLFAMFGATVLVPALTGMNPLLALLSAGIGTWIFHLCTKKMVPVFLGSSFAFIPVIIAVINGDPNNIAYVGGGVICAGALYIILSLLVKLIGIDRVKSFFPPIVTGPMIVVIGLTLAPTGIDMASGNWWIAVIVIATVIGVAVFDKGFFKLVPILIGIAVGYIASIIFDLTGISGEKALVDFSLIATADWTSFGTILKGEFFVLPKFSLEAILLIAPVALVTFMEHFGDITTNGSVVGKDFFKEPGLHRTILGDGLATMVAGFIGAPPNTTYGENTGVLAVTKMYDPRVLRIAACFAIILGLFGKFGAILQTIPVPVMGGVCIILFGMISSIGIRTLAEAELDFSHSRNLMIMSLILVLGLGFSKDGILLTFGIVSIKLSGIFIAAVVGIVLNKILPKNI